MREWAGFSLDVFVLGKITNHDWMYKAIVAMVPSRNIIQVENSWAELSQYVLMGCSMML